MADVILKVKPNQALTFTPDQLVVRKTGGDIKNGTDDVYYELTDTNLTVAPKYITREWTDRGNVKLPAAALANIYNTDGTINVVVANQILAAFNLELDTQ